MPPSTFICLLFFFHSGFDVFPMHARRDLNRRGCRIRGPGLRHHFTPQSGRDLFLVGGNAPLIFLIDGYSVKRLTYS